MIRCNPSDYSGMVAIKGSEELIDEDFYSMSLVLLKRIFRHCYHDGMDALIPAKGDFAVIFLSGKQGDILASYSPREKVVFSYSTNKKLE